jgi:hypothetical protein
MTITTHTKTAGSLKRGDIVANLGMVTRTNTVGMFTVAAIRGTDWSLATGTGDLVTRDYVWHGADNVIVAVEVN